MPTHSRFHVDMFRIDDDFLLNAKIFHGLYRSVVSHKIVSRTRLLTLVTALPLYWWMTQSDEGS